MTKQDQKVFQTCYMMTARFMKTNQKCVRKLDRCEQTQEVTTLIKDVVKKINFLNNLRLQLCVLLEDGEGYYESEEERKQDEHY